MSPSEFAHVFVDGEVLEQRDEFALFDALNADADLRLEVRDLLAIRAAVQSDVDAFMPPVDTTEHLFAALGINGAAAVAAPPAAPVTAWTRRIMVPLLAFLAGSAITAGVMYFAMAGSRNVAVTTPGKASQIDQTDRTDRTDRTDQSSATNSTETSPTTTGTVHAPATQAPANEPAQVTAPSSAPHSTASAGNPPSAPVVVAPSASNGNGGAHNTAHTASMFGGAPRRAHAGKNVAGIGDVSAPRSRRVEPGTMSDVTEIRNDATGSSSSSSVSTPASSQGQSSSSESVVPAADAHEPSAAPSLAHSTPAKDHRGPMNVAIPEQHPAADSTTNAPPEQAATTTSANAGGTRVADEPVDSATFGRGANGPVGAPDFRGAAPSIERSEWNVIVRGLSLASNPSSSLSSGSGTVPANVALGAFKIIDEHQRIGFEIAQEAFGQEFSRTTGDSMFRYQQNPMLMWGAAAYHLASSPIGYLGGIAPFVQADAGATRVGPLARVLGGLSYAVSARFEMFLGAEAAGLWYQYSSTWYSTTKVGYTYGLSVTF